MCVRGSEMSRTRRSNAAERHTHTKLYESRKTMNLYLYLYLCSGATTNRALCVLHACGCALALAQERGGLRLALWPSASLAQSGRSRAPPTVHPAASSRTCAGAPDTASRCLNCGLMLDR